MDSSFSIWYLMLLLLQVTSFDRLFLSQKNICRYLGSYQWNIHVRNQVAVGFPYDQYSKETPPQNKKRIIYILYGLRSG